MYPEYTDEQPAYFVQKIRAFCSSQSHNLRIDLHFFLYGGTKGNNGDVAQLGERYVRNVQARGSSPLISTTLLTNNYSLFVFGNP